MEVNIQNLTQSEVDEKFVRDVFRKATEAVGVRNKEVAVVLVGENKMRGLNKQYRGKNRVTDVLSFETKGDNEELGDIVVCIPRAKKQARQAGHGFEKELAILLIHGLLHLSGYDHEKQDGAKLMEDLENRILAMIKSDAEA